MSSYPKNQAHQRRSLKHRLRQAGWVFETGVLEQLVQKEPRNIEYLAALGEAYTRVQRYNRGLEVDRQLVGLEPGDPIFRYNLACSLSLNGRLEEARDALVEAIRLGYSDFDHLMTDPDLKRLRRDATFATVLEHMDRPDAGAGATSD